MTLTARRLAVPALLLAASFASRSMGFVPAVIDTDVGLYMVQARAWLAGGWPYVAVWDMHPPGAPALIALAMALFGEGVLAVRLLGIIAVALTGWGLAGLVRVGGGSRAQGLAAGLLYVVHTPLVTGLETNTEILFAPFVAAAMLLAMRAAVRALDHAVAPRPLGLAAVALPIGLALAIKQLVFFEGCLAFVVAVLPAWRRGLLRPGRVLVLAAVYAAGSAAPMVLLGLGYWVGGAFGDLWDALALAPLRYGGGRLPLAEAGWAVLAALAALALPLLLAAIGTIRPPPGLARLVALGWAWLAAASFGIAAPGMFFQHYFVMALPPLCLLAGLGAWRLAFALRPASPVPPLGALILLLALIAWRDDAVPRLQAGFGLARPDPPRAVAAALAEAVPRGSRVLVANYHPVVLVLAGMEPPSRFVFPAQLTGHFGVTLPVDADAELARILGGHPAAIVIDRGWMHTLRPAAAEAIEQALAAHYELAASVAEQRGPVQIWRLRVAGG